MIPKWLRRENKKELSEQDIRFKDVVERYKQHFGEAPSTEASSFSPEEWIEIIDRCIETNKNEWEFFGETYDEEYDY